MKITDHNIQTLCLPLSWQEGAEYIDPQLYMVELPLSQTYWVTYANLPLHYDIDRLRGSINRPIFIRGVPPRLAGQLRRKGWHLIPQGIAPLWGVKTEHSASLRTLIRRGNRHGYAESLAQDDGMAEVLFQVLRSQRKEKQGLRHLFRQNTDLCKKAYVFKALTSPCFSNKQVLASVSLTHMKSNIWHIEELLRHPQAPVGVMEALLDAIAQDLREYNATSLCLGEIPFTLHPTSPQRTYAQSLRMAGLLLQKIYDAKGLANFKYKFTPNTTIPLYLACTEPIGIRLIADITTRCSLPRVFAQKLYR